MGIAWVSLTEARFDLHRPEGSGEGGFDRQGLKGLHNMAMALLCAPQNQHWDVRNAFTRSSSRLSCSTSSGTGSKSLAFPSTSI